VKYQQFCAFMRSIALLGAALISYTCACQVINIENRRFLNDTNGFAGKMDFTYNVTSNIQQVIVAGMNIHAQYRHDRSRVLAISDISFIKAGVADFANAGYQHLRYNYRLMPRVTAEVFVQAQYNRVLLLDRRYLAGAGPRFRIIKDAVCAFTPLRFTCMSSRAGSQILSMNSTTG
jgi:hypothetical protein